MGRRLQPQLLNLAVLLLLLLLGAAPSFVVADDNAFIRLVRHQPQLRRRPAGPAGAGRSFSHGLVAPVAPSTALAASSFVNDQQGTTMAPRSKGTLPSEHWTWKRAPGQEHRIRYQRVGDSGPVLICVHGFGGNADHWRKNLPVLGSKYRVFAIDLLGYGYSDKPSPKGQPPNSLYCFETWARQLEAFVEEVAKPEGGGVHLACNSVGGLAGLQLCLDRPDLVHGILLLNISLRMLHAKKQPVLLKPFVKGLQTLLRETPVGAAFFGQVATPQGVRNALEQAYHNKAEVTDELIDVILKPGLEPGATDVFLDFISYSAGPLPEEMLPLLTETPVYIGWGEEDPWEPVELGKAYGDFPIVREFVRLPGLGHCPQDEGPDVVNALISRMVDTLEAERRQGKATGAPASSPSS